MSNLINWRWWASWALFWAGHWVSLFPWSDTWWESNWACRVHSVYSSLMCLSSDIQGEDNNNGPWKNIPEENEP